MEDMVLGGVCVVAIMSCNDTIENACTELLLLSGPSFMLYIVEITRQEVAP